jgi:hypothetical protein
LARQGRNAESGTYLHLKKLLVKEFAGKKSPSPTYGCEAEEVEDVGEVVERGDVLSENSNEVVEDTSVLGVQNLDFYVSCVGCRRKVTAKEEADTHGEFDRCEMTQKIKARPKRVPCQIVIESGTGVVRNVRAFGEVVEGVAGKERDSLTKFDLLESERFLCEAEDGIVRSVWRREEMSEAKKGSRLMSTMIMEVMNKVRDYDDAKQSL